MKLNPKITIMAIIISIIVIVAGVYFYSTKKDKSPRADYEALVTVRDQTMTNPEEDLRNSLKAGDVLLVQKTGHSWSDTEKTSYLILKMNLSEAEAQKLTQGVEKQLTNDEIKEEMTKYQANRKDIPKEDLASHEEELKKRRDVVRLRQYRIDLSQFRNFDPNVLVNGQPFLNQIFDWGIVKKK